MRCSPRLHTPGTLVRLLLASSGRSSTRSAACLLAAAFPRSGRAFALAASARLLALLATLSALRAGATRLARSALATGGPGRGSLGLHSQRLVVERELLAGVQHRLHGVRSVEVHEGESATANTKRRSDQERQRPEERRGPRAYTRAQAQRGGRTPVGSPRSGCCRTCRTARAGRPERRPRRCCSPSCLAHRHKFATRASGARK